jgi:hypothetical protein
VKSNRDLCLYGVCEILHAVSMTRDLPQDVEYQGHRIFVQLGQKIDDGTTQYLQRSDCTSANIMFRLLWPFEAR